MCAPVSIVIYKTATGIYTPSLNTCLNLFMCTQHKSFGLHMWIETPTVIAYKSPPLIFFLLSWCCWQLFYQLQKKKKKKRRKAKSLQCMARSLYNVIVLPFWKRSKAKCARKRSLPPSDSEALFVSRCNMSHPHHQPTSLLLLLLYSASLLSHVTPAPSAWLLRMLWKEHYITSPHK